MKMAENLYQDKRVDTIKKDVEEKFKQIDKILVRDDEEILNAGKAIITKYITEIKSKKDEKWGSWSLQPFIDLEKAFNKEIKSRNEKESWKLITNNKALINDVANKIDNAEKTVLQRLSFVRSKEESKLAESKSEKLNNGKKMFITNEKDGSLMLTAATNPVKIHDALNGLFDKNQQYRIDYTDCKNAAIKAKMEAFIGTGKCYISFDENSKTYLIRNSKGEVYPSQRGLIWEGVKLVPEKVIQYFGHYQKAELNKTFLTKKMSAAEYSKYKEMIPVDLKNELGDTHTRNFIEKTEYRLEQIVREAKSLGYQLHVDPIKKARSGDDLMEVKLINGNAEKNIVVWDSKKDLGEALYSILDSNEGDYATYLTSRIKDIWQKLSHWDKKENILKEEKLDTKVQKQMLTEEEKTSIKDGLSLLRTFVENHKNSEGDAYLDVGDRWLAKMIKLLNDAEYSLENTKNISKYDFEEQVIEPLFTSFAHYAYFGIKGDMKSEHGRAEYLTFSNIFFGKKSDKIAAIRRLSDIEATFDKTESSDLQNHIIDDQEDKLAFNNQGLTNMFDRIRTHFTPSKEDLDTLSTGGEKSKKLQQIDELYKLAQQKNPGGKIVAFLENNNLLWKNASFYTGVLTQGNKLAEHLNQQREMIERNFPHTVESMAEDQKREKLTLMQKADKSESDLQRLQALEYLEAHPEEQKKINENAIQVLKNEYRYGNISSMVRQTFGPVFADHGGGAKGTNAKIYNDIIGYGWFDLSDENAKIAGEILKEIAIAVVVMALTGGFGGAAIAGALRLGSLAAKGLELINLANRIEKVVRIANLGMRGFKVASTAGKVAQIGMKATGLLIEGTVFNAASKVIRNTIDGKAILDDMNLNPIAKENLQTAAFLGALSIGNYIAGMPIKPLGKTKVAVDMQKGFSAWAKGARKAAKEVGAELGVMFIAEQVMNLTFGHDILDPETGEIITIRELRWPDNQEWATMIGMILAFRVIKPQGWHKIEKRLNDGTLEICRSMDPKNPLIKNTTTGALIPLKELPQKAESLLENNQAQKGETVENKKITQEEIYREIVLREQMASEARRDLTNLEISQKQETDPQKRQTLEKEIQQKQKEVEKKEQDVQDLRKKYGEKFYGEAQSSHKTETEQKESDQVQKGETVENKKTKGSETENKKTETSEQQNISLETINGKELGDLLLQKTKDVYFENLLGDKFYGFELLKQLFQSGYRPEMTLTLQNQTFHLSKKISVYGRDYIIGYTPKGEVRLFYRSISEGCRRSTDGIRLGEGNALSKGEFIPNSSYETTTMVDYRLAQVFDKLPTTKKSQSPTQIITEIAGKQAFTKSMQAELSVEAGDKNILKGVDAYMKKTVQEAKTFFSNYSEIPIKNLTQKVGSYEFVHSELGEVKVEIVRAEYNGKPIDMHFAHSVNNNPHQIRIIKGDLVNSHLNSFGLKSKQINLGALTSKPIDYVSQVPHDLRGDPTVKRLGAEGRYIDIRFLYQEMPLIREYKKWTKNSNSSSGRETFVDSPELRDLRSLLKSEIKELDILNRKIQSTKNQDRINRRKEQAKKREKDIIEKQNKINELEKQIQAKSMTETKSSQNSDYFEGKKSKFGISEAQARQNSQAMDILANKIKSGEKKDADLVEMTDLIKTQYQQVTGRELNNFTVEQMMKIIEVHNQPGELGKLNFNELRNKVKLLNESILDPHFKRFLLESGFCGKSENIVHSTPEQIDLHIQEFDAKIMKEGLHYDGNVYKLYFESNMTQNHARKGVWKLSVNGETRFSVNSESGTIPNNSNGNRIRSEYYRLRNEYVDKKISEQPQSKEQFSSSKVTTESSQINEVLGRESIQNPKLQFNDFFQQHKGKLVGKSVWIDGQRWDIMHINKDGALQMKKYGKESEFRSLSSFKQLKDLGQVNGFADQNSTNGNKYTLSRAEAANHKLLQDLFRLENSFLTSKEVAVRDNISKEVAVRDNISKEVAIRDNISKEVAVRDNISKEVAVRDNISKEVAVRDNISKEVAVRDNISKEVAIRDNISKAIMKSGEKFPPAIREQLSSALILVEKAGGLPAVIEKAGGIKPLLEKNGYRGIIPPYWLIPLLIAPGLHRGDGDPIAPTFELNQLLKKNIEDIIENPKHHGVELDTDITGPYDTRVDQIALKADIDQTFESLLKENNILEPLNENALIILRGVASWTYAGSGNGVVYNERLANKRSEEFKKYLMEKYPMLTENNFVTGSFYQGQYLDEAKRFQGVSMRVLDMKKYGGTQTIASLINQTSGTDGRVK